VPAGALYETENNARAALLLGGSGSNQAYLALASIYAERGDYRAEAQDLQTYLKLEPSDPDKQKLHDILEAVLRLAYNMAKAR
jgi:regulator of sirC expression with transglutaminase-like and TPR domain